MTPTHKRTPMEQMSQVAIFVAAVSMVVVGGGNPWGFVIALAIQPFWFYTSYNHRQWGLFYASFIYSFAWTLGIYRNWDHYMSAFN